MVEPVHSSTDCVCGRFIQKNVSLFCSKFSLLFDLQLVVLCFKVIKIKMILNQRRLHSSRDNSYVHSCFFFPIMKVVSVVVPGGFSSANFE